MNKDIILKIIIILILFNFIRIFFDQEKMIKSYEDEKQDYENKIEIENEKGNSLNETLKNINSVNYIEGIARDKLDMYLPNEKVYVDSSK